MKQTIYAVIGTGDDGGIIVLGSSASPPVPLVCMEGDGLDALLRAAQFVHAETGREVIVAKFDMEKVLERFNGRIL